jgi:hypothetical protein
MAISKEEGRGITGRVKRHSPKLGRNLSNLKNTYSLTADDRPGRMIQNGRLVLGRSTSSQGVQNPEGDGFDSE